MDRSGDAVLWAAGLHDYPSLAAAPDAIWLLVLCLVWILYLPLTIGSPRADFRMAAPRPALAARPVAKAALRALRRTTPPALEPRPSLPLTPEAARAFNAGVPVVDGPISSARKFIYAGSADDRQRALVCLASAAWYEAGDDRDGEEAVAQVVLNRLRHPAFPKTVCGVVFEGTNRKTGCQFSFTCDGALRRIPGAAAWQRARAIADHALSGFVFGKVGNATHYHADWVVPYWSDALDKLTEVKGHLFYRWRGWWGRAAAFSARPGGPEELDPRIAYLLPAGPRAIAPTPSASALATLVGAQPRPLPPLAISPAPPRVAATVLPLSPESVRRILPAVVPAKSAVAESRPAAIRYSLPAQQPRLKMSFNQPVASPTPPGAAGMSISAR